MKETETIERLHGRLLSELLSTQLSGTYLPCTHYREEHPQTLAEKKHS